MLDREVAAVPERKVKAPPVGQGAGCHRREFPRAAPRLERDDLEVPVRPNRAARVHRLRRAGFRSVRDALAGRAPSPTDLGHIRLRDRGLVVAVHGLGSHPQTNKTIAEAERRAARRRPSPCGSFRAFAPSVELCRHLVAELVAAVVMRPWLVLSLLFIRCATVSAGRVADHRVLTSAGRALACPRGGADAVDDQAADANKEKEYFLSLQFDPAKFGFLKSVKRACAALARMGAELSKLLWPQQPSGRPAKATAREEDPLSQAYPRCARGSFRAAIAASRAEAKLMLLVVADARSQGTRTLLAAVGDSKLHATLGEHFVTWGSAQPSTRAVNAARQLGLKAAVPTRPSSAPLLAVVLAPAPEYEGDATPPRVISQHHCKPPPSARQMAAWLNRTLTINAADVRKLRDSLELRELKQEQMQQVLARRARVFCFASRVRVTYTHVFRRVAQFQEGLHADRARVERAQQVCARGTRARAVRRPM